MFYHFLSFSMVTCIYNKRCSQYLQRSLQQHVQHLFVGIKKHLPTSTLEDLWDFHQRCSSFSPCSSRSNPAGIWGRGWCQLKSWDPKCSQKLKPVHFHHFVADTVQSMFFFPETFKFCRILCRSPMIRPGHRAPLKNHPEDQNNVTSSSGCMNSGTWFHVNMVAECHVLLFHTFPTVRLCIRSMFSLRVQLAQEVTKTIWSMFLFLTIWSMFLLFFPCKKTKLQDDPVQ